MRKITSTLLALFIFSAIYAQNTKGIKGITITGIKGIKKSLASIIAAQDLKVPSNYKIRLRPELEGPEPKGQNPNAIHASKAGTLISGNNYKTTSTSAPTQTVNSNFLTIWGSYSTVTGRESPYTPPDNCGDVGSTQIIATANCRMKVFNKPALGTALTTPTGTSTTVLTPVANINLNTFFTVSSIGVSSISDPHVRFDRFSGRWFIVAIDVNHTHGSNYCLIAVSNSATITDSSSFKIYYFSVAGTGGASNDFFDYPTLGVDKNSLYIGGNMFASGVSFSGCNMWVINKASILNGGTMSLTSFPHGAAATDIYTPQGVQNDDPNATYGYFVGASQTVYSKLIVKRVSYSGTSVTLSSDLPLNTLATYTPKTVPTLGGTSIDGDDRRLCAAMIKKNKIDGTAHLWIAQGTLLNSSGSGGSGGDRDGAYWAEIGNLETTPAFVKQSMLFDSLSTTNPVNYTYPTIALSGQGHNVMGFTSAGAQKYAQAGVAGRYRTDPPYNFQSPADFTSTNSTYNPGATRWGDYTQTVVDPKDDMTMWTFSEYVPTTNAWGVRAAQLMAPPPPTPSLVSAPACGTTTTVTINGTPGSNPNSEFFDPGADPAGAAVTYNHLNVAISVPGATVSNITFVSTTQVKADITVPANTASGQYTLTVTNPDGQSSSVPFSLTCSPPACGDPTVWNASPVDNNTENITWHAVTNADFDYYLVEYQVAGAGSWSTVTPNPTTNSATLSSLIAGTTYNYRITAHCSAGYGNAVSSSFTTTAPAATCDVPTGLDTSAITSNSATVSWSTVSGGSYDVQYKISSTTTWSASQNTTSTSLNLAGLSSSTSYDWQVRTNCGTNGNSSYVPGKSFTTACPDNYESNDVVANAKTIAVGGSGITATIGYPNDIDWYSFTTSGNQKNIKVSVTSPYNINLTLYSSNGTSVLGTPAQNITSGSVVYNTNKSGSYKIKVDGTPGLQCYNLIVSAGSTTYTAAIADEGSSNIGLVKGGALKLYPVPATNAVTVSFDAYAKGNADIVIINQLGQQVLYKKVLVNDGTNVNTLDVSALKAGVYTLKVNNGKEIQTKKMIISR